MERTSTDPASCSGLFQMLREGPLCLQRRTPIPGDAAVVTGRQSRQDHSSLHVSLCPVNQLRRDRKAPEGRTWGRGESQALNLSSCHSLGEGAQHGGGGSSPQGSHIYVWWGGLFSIVLQSSSVPPWSQQLTRLRTHWVPCSSVLTIRHGPTGSCYLHPRTSYIMHYYHIIKLSPVSVYSKQMPFPFCMPKLSPQLPLLPLFPDSSLSTGKLECSLTV